jgi:hypothetical protein
VITSPFVRLELWSDLRLSFVTPGTRLGAWNLGQIAAAQVSYALEGVESLLVAVPLSVGTTQMVDSAARQVIRICGTDPTEIEEWRIAETEVDSDSGLMVIRCDSLLLELARTVYMATDGTGQPQPEFTAIEIDAEGIWDGPITDALTAVGLTQFAKGTIEPTATFGIDLSWATPLEFLRAVQARTGAEMQVRNDPTLDPFYRVDILDRGGIGRLPPPVIARTTRNLLSNERRIEYAEGGNRVIPRGQDDSTSRGIGYAYWEVIRILSGNIMDIRDPRGAGFPSPFLGNSATELFVCKVSPTYISEEVLASFSGNPGETQLLVNDTSAFTAGDLVEFRLVDAVDGQRVFWQRDEYPLVSVFDAILDRPTASGVVNYAPNPFVRDYTGTVDATGLGGISSDEFNPVVTFDSANPITSVSVGDILVRDSDSTVVGTVLSVDNSTEVTLTSNAAITDIPYPYRVRKPAPAGAVIGTAVATFLSQQVDSDVPGVMSKAWQIESATQSPTIATPAMPLSVSADTPWNIWCWLRVDAVPSSTQFQIRLVDAVTLTQIGSNVVLLEDTTVPGSLIRVLFQSPDISAATNGVRVSVVGTQPGSDYTIGPWGAQPAGWAITDVEQPRACDLWHEGTLWLQNRKTPTSYKIGLADLAALDGTRFPDDVLTLGGSIVVDDRELGIVSTQRVVAFTRNLLTPGDVQVTLGSRDRTLAEYLAAQTGLNVADAAVQISKGLLSEAGRIASAPTFTATTAGVTPQDASAPESVGLALRTSFKGSQ